jgi:hypothetical protein
MAAAVVVAAVMAAVGGWWHVRSRRELTSAAGEPGQGRNRSRDQESALSPIDRALASDANGSERSAEEMVMAWADGRVCVSCGGELLESRLHHIALLEPNGTTREWVDIAADRLPLALATCLPMCWNCHVAATFRRLHPELVTDREETATHADVHGRNQTA